MKKVALKTEVLKTAMKKAGTNAHALGLELFNNPDAVRTIVTRGNKTDPSRAAAIAQRLGMDPADLIDKPKERLRYRSDSQLLVPQMLGEVGFEPTQSLGRVPVYGTVAAAKPGAISILDGDIIDYFPRPPRLAYNKDVYGLYVTGDSMYPRYEEGHRIYVDPSRPVAPGDDVVVQLVDREEGGVALGMIKTLIRRSSSFIKLLQHNPKKELTVQAAEYAAMHKILSIEDLLGF